jgi:hypothetical protein
MKWNGTLIALSREVSLAPSTKWQEQGQCGQACQDKVSACLLALTNDLCTHITVELTVPWHEDLVTDHE